MRGARIPSVLLVAVAACHASEPRSVPPKPPTMPVEPSVSDAVAEPQYQRAPIPRLPPALTAPEPLCAYTKIRPALPDPLLLRLSPRGPVYATVWRASRLDLVIPADTRTLAAFVTVHTAGMTLRGFLEPSDTRLYPLRPLVLSDVAMPRPTTPLTWLRTVPGQRLLVGAELARDALLHPKSFSAEVTCADLGLTPVRFEILDERAVSTTEAVTVPSCHHVELAPSPFGRSVVSVDVCGSDIPDPPVFTAIERRGGVRKIAIEASDALLVGWTPARKVEGEGWLPCGLLNLSVDDDGAKAPLFNPSPAPESTCAWSPPIVVRFDERDALVGTLAPNVGIRVLSVRHGWTSFRLEQQEVSFSPRVELKIPTQLMYECGQVSSDE